MSDLVGNPEDRLYYLRMSHKDTKLIRVKILSPLQYLEWYVEPLFDVQSVQSELLLLTAVCSLQSQDLIYPPCLSLKGIFSIT